MDLPIHWLERWVNHEQALYLLACGDSKLDEVFTDLRVRQNILCARPVCSMHIARSLCCTRVQCVSDCHIMISVASVMQIIGLAALAGDIKNLTDCACIKILLHRIALAHARPTMPCILLVYLYIYEGQPHSW